MLGCSRTRGTDLVPSSAAGDGGARAQPEPCPRCDDGVFCNGDERYVNGACTAATSPCDDGAACTTDQCDEEREQCTFVLAADCYTCDRAECDPVCTGKECGDDGCGGSCGACGVGALCIAGACTTDAPPGTCLSPITLLAPDAALLGPHVITGDTSTGFHSVSPTCNTVSDAREPASSWGSGSPVAAPCWPGSPRQA